MSVNSAIPEELQRFGRLQLPVAEQLLLCASALHDAQTRFAASCQFFDLALSWPGRDTATDLRAVGRRMLHLSTQTSRVGDVFAHADRTRGHRDVVVISTAAFSKIPSTFDQTSGLAADLTALSVTDRRALLSQLDSSVLHTLAVRHPRLVGNTDGVPWRVRLQANQVQIARELTRAQADGDTALIALLQRLQTEQVLIFEPTQKRLAVLHGDLDRAENVAVFVPGMGSNFEGFFGGNNGTDNKATAIYREADRRGPRKSAIISWLGYPAPPTLPDAAVSTSAKKGAERLETFIDGLQADGNHRTVIVAHSYGTLVAGEALRRGSRVDSVVLAGSPGIGFDHAEALQSKVHGSIYALAAPGDPVAHLSWFGNDPDAKSFGAIRLTTNAPGKPRVEKHSSYFLPGSESVSNIAAVVSNDTEALEVHDPSLLDGFEDRITSHRSRMLGPLSYFSDHYNGPGSGVVERANGTARILETLPAHAIEGTSVVVESAGNTVAK